MTQPLESVSCYLRLEAVPKGGHACAQFAFVLANPSDPTCFSFGRTSTSLPSSLYAHALTCRSRRSDLYRRLPALRRAELAVGLLALCRPQAAHVVPGRSGSTGPRARERRARRHHLRENFEGSWVWCEVQVVSLSPSFACRGGTTVLTVCSSFFCSSEQVFQVGRALCALLVRLLARTAPPKPLVFKTNPSPTSFSARQSLPFFEVPCKRCSPVSLSLAHTLSTRTRLLPACQKTPPMLFLLQPRPPRKGKDHLRESLAKEGGVEVRTKSQEDDLSVEADGEDLVLRAGEAEDFL